MHRESGPSRRLRAWWIGRAPLRIRRGGRNADGVHEHRRRVRRWRHWLSQGWWRGRDAHDFRRQRWHGWRWRHQFVLAGRRGRYTCHDRFMRVHLRGRFSLLARRQGQAQVRGRRSQQHHHRKRGELRRDVPHPMLHRRQLSRGNQRMPGWHGLRLCRQQRHSGVPTHLTGMRGIPRQNLRPRRVLRILRAGVQRRLHELPALFRSLHLREQRRRRRMQDASKPVRMREAHDASVRMRRRDLQRRLRPAHRRGRSELQR